MIRAIIILVVLGIVLYVLYERGIAATKVMSARIFVGSMGFGKPCCKARFTSANGWKQRIVRFQENREYKFLLEGEIKKGTVSVELINAYKEKVLTLYVTGTAPKAAARVMAEQGQRYELVVTFEHADGNYMLTWE